MTNESLNRIKDILLQADSEASSGYLLGVIDEALETIMIMGDAAIREDAGSVGTGNTSVAPSLTNNTEDKLDMVKSKNDCQKAFERTFGKGFVDESPYKIWQAAWEAKK